MRFDSFAMENGHEVRNPNRPGFMLTGRDIDRVYCDGDEIKFVVEFDDQEGWVDFYPSVGGVLSPPPDADSDHLDTERRQGRITYILVRLK